METTTKTKMIEIERVDGAYRLECPVCKQRIQSETSEGEWEGGFEGCPHLYIAYLCDSGMYYPNYKNKKEVAKVEADLEVLKEKVAYYIAEKENYKIETPEELAEMMQWEVSEEWSVIYLANHLPENMVAYHLDVPTGGCGGGTWTVDNLFIFKVK